jgi:hypothetical protein
MRYALGANRSLEGASNLNNLNASGARLELVSLYLATRPSAQMASKLPSRARTGTP